MHASAIDYGQLVADAAMTPTIEAGRIASRDDGQLFVELRITSKLYEKSNTVKMLHTALLVLNSADSPTAKTISICPANEAKFSRYSPSGRWSVTGIARKSDEKQLEFIEVYDNGRLMGSAPVHSLHGEFCTDATFGGCAWNEDLKQFCYIAEAKNPERDSPDSYNLATGWGEKLISRIRPSLFRLNLETMTVAPIDTPDGSPASPCILPNGAVAYVSFKSDPVKLGLSYCFNRPSEIAIWDPTGNTKTQLGYSVRSLHTIGQRLYFLRNPIGGSHFTFSELCSVNPSLEDLQIHSDGLFCQGMSHSESHLFINVVVRSTRHVVRFDPRTNILDNLTHEHGDKCFDFLCARDDIVIMATSTSCNPQSLVLWNEGKLHFIESNSVGFLQGTTKVLQNATCSIVKLHSNAEVVLIKPSQPNGKLVLYPHGGPNSVCYNDFYLFRVCLAIAGYTVAAINYTGSIGFSKEAIGKLEGQIGILDVEDVLKAAQLLSDNSCKKIFLLGGSHGGYINAMLTAKYPDRFAGCVLMNPVTDLPSMSYSSDIMDWTFGQMKLDFDLCHPKPATKEQLLTLYEHSPSSRVTNATTPTLVILGEKDNRVPPFQGRAWYYWLRGKGVQAKCLSFPDSGHSLDTPIAEKNSMLAILNFFNSL